MQNVRATILIKSNDQQRYLEQAFPQIANQSEQSFEIVFLYSGVSNSSIELAQRSGARVIRIDSRDFSHPKALNVGARDAKGEFLVALSADAVPAHSRWLEFLLRRFSDAKVAGVYGRHMPRGESSKNLASLVDAARMYRKYPADSKTRCFGDGHPFSNANSAIRRSLWERHPFDESLFEVEDYEWAGWAQGNGYCIVYDAEAAIQHTHWEQYGLIGLLSRAFKYKRLRGTIDKKLSLVTSLS